MKFKVYFRVNVQKQFQTNEWVDRIITFNAEEWDVVSSVKEDLIQTVQDDAEKVGATYDTYYSYEILDIEVKL